MRRSRPSRIGPLLALALGPALAACGGEPPSLASLSIASAPGSLSDGAEVELRLTARGAEGEPVLLQVLGIPGLSGRPQVLETHTLYLDESQPEQSAEFRWRASGAILLLEGRNEVFFRAHLGEQTADSSSLVVEVLPRLVGIEVHHLAPRGPRKLAQGDELPLDAELELWVSTEKMAGRRTLEIELLLSGTGSPSRVGSLTTPIRSDLEKLRFQLDPTTFGATDRATLFFRIAHNDETVQSPPFTAKRTGIYECGWRRSDGAAINGTLRSGVAVKMQADLWGLDGEQGVIELWEEDDGSADDFIGRFTRTAAGNLLEVEWTTEFVSDGVLSTENEYYFTIALGELRCRSEVLDVSS